MFPYNSPGLCARCGSLYAARTWKVNQSTGRFNLWAFLVTWFGLNVPGYTPNTVNVPVCSACETKLEKTKKLTRRITISLAVILGLSLCILYLAIGIRGYSLALGLLIMLFVTLFGALLGTAGGIIFGLIIQEALNYEFCNYDGQYYQFTNKKFRREFATLNPTLVKQKK